MGPSEPRAVGPAVSTYTGVFESRMSCAIPHVLHLMPTQLTALPKKFRLAYEPAVVEYFAEPSLKAASLSLRPLVVQLPLNVTGPVLASLSASMRLMTKSG